MAREKRVPERGPSLPGSRLAGTFHFVIYVLREPISGKMFPLTKRPLGDSLSDPPLRVLTEFLRTLKRGQVHEFKSNHRRRL